ILKTQDADEQRRQINESKQQLEQWLGAEVKHFAYPNGVEGTDFDDTSVEIVRESGFQSAVVTNWGVSDSTTSQFKLKRFTPWDNNKLKFHLRMIMQSLKESF